jgi:hypothetical protein
VCAGSAPPRQYQVRHYFLDWSTSLWSLSAALADFLNASSARGLPPGHAGTFRPFHALRVSCGPRIKIGAKVARRQ